MDFSSPKKSARYALVSIPHNIKSFFEKNVILDDLNIMVRIEALNNI